MADTKQKKYIAAYADLMTEWDWRKNNELYLSPYELNAGSHKKAWWICNTCNHSWFTEVRYRSSGRGCPKCNRIKAANTKATPKPGKSLKDLFPSLAQEWDCDKNGSLKPEHFNIGSQKQVYWRCGKGHSWKAAINKRTYRNQGCPICNSAARTSFPEQVIFYYISKIYSACNRHIIQGYEFDVYIPSHNIAIEYDGQYWHDTVFSHDMEIRKNAFCKDNGITLFRIKDNASNDVPCIVDTTLYYKYTSNHTFLNSAVQLLIERLCLLTNTLFPVSINIDRDRSDIMASYQHMIYENSVAALPDLLAEWDFDHNGGLTPENVSCGSETKVWWVCSKGHSYFARVSSRTKGRGCPYCANKKIIKGENDLLTKNPTLAIEWNYERNAPLSPNEVSVSASKSVWWKCSSGHEWKATINSRNADNRGCPYCSGRYAIVGENDLETLFPEIAVEWDWVKNAPLLPSTVKPKSSKKVWWLGKCGHSWQAEISKRTNGQNCPYCSGHRILSGFNDLATKRPELALELIDPLLSPQNVSEFSHKKALWKCSQCSYEWTATIANRSCGNGCPNCSRARQKSTK